MADPFQLDPEIAALADGANVWLTCVAVCAQALGVTMPWVIEAIKQRLYTGYMPKEQRNAADYLAYCEGLKFPKTYVHVGDPRKVRAKASKFYGPRPLLRGEVRA